MCKGNRRNQLFERTIIWMNYNESAPVAGWEVRCIEVNIFLSEPNAKK